MRKDDLKVGYVVETRNKGLFMVADNSHGKYRIQNRLYADLEDYTDDLLFMPNYPLHEMLGERQDFDIVKVYGYPESGFSFVISTKRRLILWEREECVSVKQEKSCDYPYYSNPFYKGKIEFDLHIKKE